MLDIIMMTIMCTLLHVCDKEKRLGFMNPTQINQLELNSVINEKSEMFKGMSKKKRVTTITTITSTHIGQLFQWFKDRQCIMVPYNFE
jgi:hypothetical protein